jgi:hypothetical protein
MWRVSAVLVLLALIGCTRTAWKQAAPGAAVGLAAAAAAAPVAKLMLFGGDGHKTYLGCLNCSEYATDSVFNRYGDHGSPYSLESISNRYSEFGSPYSMYGACNRYASDPPVIVDSNGMYYGRLTLNTYHAEIASGRQYVSWLAAVCEH